MLKGFLNHGCVIVNDLLLGTRTRVHTVSFPARRARLRRSAGHTTIYVFDMCLLENQRYINIYIDNNDNKNSNNNDNDNYNDNEIMI